MLLWAIEVCEEIKMNQLDHKACSQSKAREGACKRGISTDWWKKEARQFSANKVPKLLKMKDKMKDGGFPQRNVTCMKFPLRNR